MSISVTLIPLALLITMVAGEERVQEWSDAASNYVPTVFTDLGQLKQAVHKAGYDCGSFMFSNTMMKTHLDDDTYIFWELKDGRWCLSVPTNTADADRYQAFIDKLEMRNQMYFFMEKPLFQSAAENPNAIPTEFVDRRLLVQTLNNAGAEVIEYPDGEVVAKVDGGKLRFVRKRNETGPYRMVVEAEGDIQDLYAHIKLLDADYRQNVQAYTYEHLKDHIQEHQLQVEREEVLDDNSILLTLTVQE